MPTDDDLVSVLRRGLPGSAMPGFAWLSDDALRGLARHVRGLAVERLAADLLAGYRAAGEALTPAQAREAAEWRMQPGEVVAIPKAPAAVDDAMLARGRQAYVERCAACHGTDGKGQAPDARWREFGDLQWARDLTDGVLEGGATFEELGRRIVAGMPGAAMPPQRFADPAGLVALIAYVQSLLPPDAGERGVTHRQVLAAARADGGLPVTADDPRWDDAASIDVVMMPLATRPESVTDAQIAAFHDGARLAVRLSWNDATRDDSAIAGKWPDGCALQLSGLADPPLFGMGTHERPHDIWYWSAFRFRDVAGGLDLVIGPDGRVIEVPLAGKPAPGETAPAHGADVVRSEGMGEGAVAEGAMRAEPQWRDGRWSVVLVRELVRDGESVGLAPGGAARVSFAIWNGSNGDRRGRKSISVWHELRLEP